LQSHRQAAVVIHRDEAEQGLFDRVAVVFESGVTLPMPGAVSVLLPIGCGVGDQTAPISSSLIYMAVPGGSEIGSFDHGVRRSSWLLLPQTHSEPASEIKAPKSGLAMMLTQGERRLPARVRDR
jgi:hypothetical protein